MVASVKDRARSEFGKRLTDHLGRLGVKPRGHINFVFSAMKKADNKVSYETCRKWVRGIDFPDEANLELLAAAIGANPVILRYGSANSFFVGNDDGSAELLSLWAELDNEDRNHVLKSARLAAQAKTAKKAKRA